MGLRDDVVESLQERLFLAEDEARNWRKLFFALLVVGSIIVTWRLVT